MALEESNYLSLSPLPHTLKFAKLGFQHIYCLLIFLNYHNLMIGKFIIVEHHLGFIKLKFSCPPPSLLLLNRCAKLFFLFIIIANTALLLYSSIFSIVEQTVGFNNSNLTLTPDPTHFQECEIQSPA